MNILLIGAPGAGKGTQAEKLSQLFALRHVASGDLFHKAFEEQTELGLKAQRYVDLGELVPDAITIPMVMRHLEEPESLGGCCWMAIRVHSRKRKNWIRDSSRSADRSIWRSTCRCRAGSYCA